MPVSTKTLRVAIAATAAVLLFSVVGFYGYARYKVVRAIGDVPKKLGVDVQQSASGFKVSKSEGGRMLFSISASSAVQYKGSGRAALSDTRIVVYNRGKGSSDPATDIYDQIYGKQFDYDHATGEVTATGEVMFDLQSHGAPPDDPTKTTASPGSLHLKTSGLTFNEKTGTAETDKTVEFSLPQGRGSALGAVYDSKLMTLHLKSDVRVQTSPQARATSTPVTITARNADIFDMPREAILSEVHVEDEQRSRSLSAGRLTISLRDDNTIEKAQASGGVNGHVSGAKSDDGMTMQSSQAQLLFGATNEMKTVILSGNVKLDSSRGAKEEIHATAGRAELEFGAKRQLAKVHATQSVALSKAGGKGKQDGFALNASGVDFFLKEGNQLDRAVTSGAARFTNDSRASTGQKSGTHTVATADRFEAAFASGITQNRMESVHGTGNTKVVSSSAGNPDRITTGLELSLRFDPKSGGIAAVEQKGDFKYVEGSRSASAERAALDVSADQLTLAGSPRVQDGSQGFALTANAVKMNRRSGDMDADGEVKATYNQPKTNANGAMFSGHGGDPIHATSQRMTVNKASGVAKFMGNARLWQGANLVEAPLIAFDKDKRGLTADAGENAGRVQTAFVQIDKKGRVTPVSVVAGKLVYSDVTRKARFEGGVRVRSADMTLVADHAEVFLKAKSSQSAAGKDSSSQIERIEAEGQIVLEEQNPVRRVTGSRLTYGADEGKFVMSGDSGKPPSIFDAERGDVTGDSLTFYMRDDRVQIGSGENSRVVTRTRIKDERKP